MPERVAVYAGSTGKLIEHFQRIYTRIETGKNVCSFELLINIAELLNCSTDYLLLGKESERENLRDELRQISIELSSFVNRL